MEEKIECSAAVAAAAVRRKRTQRNKTNLMLSALHEPESVIAWRCFISRTLVLTWI